MKKRRFCLFKLIKFSLLSVLLIGLSLYFITKEKSYTIQHLATEGNTVTIFLIDGLSKNIFNEMLTTGQLPNLQQIIHKSTFVEHGIGAFPSMTGYAFYPFLTGQDATKSGILGLRWFDRSRDVGNLRHYVGRTNIHMNRDILPEPQTLFEKYNQYYTSSINTYMNRGVHHAEMTGWAHTTAKYQSQTLFKTLRQLPFWGEDLAKNHFQHESLVMEKALKQLQRNPKVQWVTFPAPDASHHVLGTSAEYYQILKHIDSLIGVFIKEVEKLGQTPTRMIAIVTDHGVSDVSKNLDIPLILKQNYGINLIRGKATNLYSEELTEKLTDFVDKNGYFVINGNLSAYIYLRDTVDKPLVQHWRNRLSFNALENYPCIISGKETTIHLPKTLAAIEGVELIICRKNDSLVTIFSDKGNSEIRQSSNGYQYVFSGEDPLNYAGNSRLKTMIQNGLHTANEWLEASLQTDYPDAIHRIYQLAMANNAGDIILTTKKGYDVAADYEMFVGNYKGGHGGIRSELLDVPYILYFPNSPKKRLPYARAEEVGGMILQFLQDSLSIPSSGKTHL